MLLVPYVKEPAKNFTPITKEEEVYDEEDLARLELERQKERDKRAKTRLAYLTRMQKTSTGATNDTGLEEDEFSSSSSSSSSSGGGDVSSSLSGSEGSYDGNNNNDDDSEDTFAGLETPRAFNDMTVYLGKMLEEAHKTVVQLKAQEDGTFLGVIKRLRRERAKARRHRGLRHFEMKERREREEKKEAEEMKELERQWSAAFRAARGEKTVKAKDNLVSVRMLERQRFNRDMHKRDKKTKGLKWFLDQTVQWDLDRKKRKEEAAMEAQKEVERQEKLRQLAEAKALEDLALKERTEEVVMSQQMLSMLRRSGGLPSVNPLVVGEPEMPIETDLVVTLRPRPGAVVTINTSKGKDESNRVSYFQVDLKRFRFVEVVKGEKLGPKGGVALAGDIKDNCWPKVHTLDLRSCKIGRLGMDALSRSFTTELGKLIETMDLKDNDLTGESMVELGAALKNGALPLLQTLDLRGNLLKDHGACHLSSFLFAKLFVSLRRLYLQRNSIRDKGALALYRVFEGGNKLCPTIEEVNLQQNNITHLGFNLMPLCPPCLKM